MHNIISSRKEAQEVKLRKLVDYLVTDTKERILNLAFPEILEQRWFWKWRFHKWDVFDHTRQTIMNYQAMDFLSEEIRVHLKTRIDWMSKDALLLIAMAFHDSWKLSQFKLNWRSRWHAEYTIANQIDAIADRFHLTENQKEFIWNIIRYHDVPPENMGIFEEIIKAKGIFIEYLIIAYCDMYATMGIECTKEELYKRREVVERRLQEIG